MTQKIITGIIAAVILSGCITLPAQDDSAPRNIADVLTDISASARNMQAIAGAWQAAKEAGDNRELWRQTILALGEAQRLYVLLREIEDIIK